MVADGLLTRQRYREVPPRVDYELTERSRELAPVIGALARWGYDWTWSAPREGEEVSIGAIFRAAPGHLSPQASLKGVVEFVCEERNFVLTVRQGSVEISEQPADATDARVTGNPADWVAALGPDGDTSSLKYEGDRKLADGLLDGFIAAASNRAAA